MVRGSVKQLFLESMPREVWDQGLSPTKILEQGKAI